MTQPENGPRGRIPGAYTPFPGEAEPEAPKPARPGFSAALGLIVIAALLAALVFLNPRPQPPAEPPAAAPAQAPQAKVLPIAAPIHDSIQLIAPPAGAAPSVPLAPAAPVEIVTLAPHEDNPGSSPRPAAQAAGRCPFVRLTGSALQPYQCHKECPLGFQPGDVTDFPEKGSRICKSANTMGQ